LVIRQGTASKKKRRIELCTKWHCEYKLHFARICDNKTSHFILQLATYNKEFSIEEVIVEVFNTYVTVYKPTFLMYVLGTSGVSSPLQ
jgi:hypothetical protein